MYLFPNRQVKMTKWNNKVAQVCTPLFKWGCQSHSVSGSNRVNVFFVLFFFSRHFFFPTKEKNLRPRWQFGLSSELSTLPFAWRVSKSLLGSGNLPNQVIPTRPKSAFQPTAPLKCVGNNVGPLALVDGAIAPPFLICSHWLSSLCSVVDLPPQRFLCTLLLTPLTNEIHLNVWQLSADNDLCCKMLQQVCREKPTRKSENEPWLKFSFLIIFLFFLHRFEDTSILWSV